MSNIFNHDDNDDNHIFVIFKLPRVCACGFISIPDNVMLYLLLLHIVSFGWHKIEKCMIFIHLVFQCRSRKMRNRNLIFSFLIFD
jgi:hypothetical protein